MPLEDGDDDAAWMCGGVRSAATDRPLESHPPKAVGAMSTLFTRAYRNAEERMAGDSLIDRFCENLRILRKWDHLWPRLVPPVARSVSL
jgi:hypothetical protein